MATSNGPWQNHARIEWVYTVPGVTQSTTRLTASVEAYFRMESSGGWNQNYTGWRAWSGHWGSGGSSFHFNLGPGQRVRMVHGGGSAVTLTDSWQTRTFAVHADHWFGRTGSTLTVRYPPRYARTPTGLTITRNSDTSHRLNWNRNSTYSSVIVQRRESSGSGWGSWRQIARPSGNAYTYTDTTTRANRAYQYRVAGYGGSGQSPWSSAATVYTTPSAPTGVSATRLANDNIRVDASGKPPFATSFDIQDGTTTVATGVSLPWTHVSPNPATTHQYRIRAKRGSLTSSYSSYSNTVQLQAPPNAPMNLTPNGEVLPAMEDVVLRWQHNPVDSSEQTQWEVDIAFEPGIWVANYHGTTEESLTLPEWQAWPDHYWRVRTRGAHPEWGPWSSVANFTLIDRPGVAIDTPTDTYDLPELTVEWTFTQVQDWPQSAWRARLLTVDGQVIEQQDAANDARSVTFDHRIEDGETYQVEVEAAAANDIWSETAFQEFRAIFARPAPPSMFGEWQEETGSHVLEVHTGDSLTPVESFTNEISNPRFAPNNELTHSRRNILPNPLLSESFDGWESASAITLEHEPVNGGRRFYVASATSGTRSVVISPSVSVEPGQYVRFRVRVRNVGTSSFYLFPAITTTSSTHSGAEVSIPAGQTVELVYGTTVSAGGFSTSLRTSQPIAGRTFVVEDGWTIEEFASEAEADAEANTQPFSGDSTDTPATAFEWEGDRNDSPSLMRYSTGAVEVYRNLFTNPRLVGDGTYATVAENLFTNPRFVGDGTWMETRRNLFKNPSFETAVSAAPVFDDSYNFSQSSFFAHSGDHSLRMQVASGNRRYTVYLPPVQIVPNQTYTVSAYGMVPSRDFTISVGFTFTNSESTPSGLGYNAGDSSTYSAGVWGRASYTATAPDATYAHPVVFIRSSSLYSSSEPAYVDDVLIERAQSVHEYYDGSTPDFSVDPDMRTRWLGTPNASESVMEIERVAGLTGSNAIAGVSTWEGKPAVRVIPTGSGLSMAFAVIPVTAPSVTVVGTVSLDAPLQGTLDDSALTLDAGGASASAPNLAGDHPLRVMDGEPTGGVVAIALSNGATLGNGDVWWTDVGLFAGNYIGEAFHGSSDPAETGFEQPGDFHVRWAGDVDNSTSVMEIETVRGLTAVNCVAGVSTRGEKPAVRLIPTGESISSYVWSTVPIEARAGGTLLGTLHLDEPLTGSLSTYALSIRVQNPLQEESAPNTAGEHPLRLRFSELISSNTLTLYHGGVRGSGDVWWTDIGLYAGKYVHENFHGDTGESFDPDMWTEWAGEPDNSPSVAKGYAPRGWTTSSGVVAITSENYAPEGARSVRLISKARQASDGTYASINFPLEAIDAGKMMTDAHLDEEVTELAPGPHSLPPGALAAQTGSLAHVAPPNATGSTHLELPFTSEFGFTYILNHGGMEGEPDVYFTKPALYYDDRDLPYADGASGLIRVGDTWMEARWTGEIDNSETLVMQTPPTTELLLERSVDGGVTWEHVTRFTAENLDILSDWEGLSFGTTLYRVTAFTAAGASSAYIEEVESDSKAMWLGGGAQFSDVARLHGDPSRSLNRGRMRITEEYEGRSLPVAYSSRRTHREVTATGTVFDIDEDGAARDDLERVILEPSPIHLFRDFAGMRIYGSVSFIDLTSTGRTSLCDDGRINTLWQYGFGVVESDRSMIVDDPE